jgi:monofunctional biosynthetic peptidoglycan transglycosylase
MPDPTTGETTHDEPTRATRFLWLKIPAALVAAGLAFECLFLAWYWIVPPWKEMREGKIPASSLIEEYKAKAAEDKSLPPLKWKPIVKPVPKSVSKVFVLAEDSRFYEHDGFDYEAIEKAIAYNWQKKKIVRGASTISQQTAKNLFLSLSRSPLRKWHEVLLTYLLEAKLNKSEILHAYLNVAEFGRGIYGIEAAAQAYFRRSAQALTQAQAVQLAATLPSPKKHNPRSMTKAFQQRNRRVSAALRMVDQYAQGRKPKDAAATSSIPTSAELAERLREVMADPQPLSDDADTSETIPDLPKDEPAQAEAPAPSPGIEAPASESPAPRESLEDPTHEDPKTDGSEPGQAEDNAEGDE